MTELQALLVVFVLLVTSMHGKYISHKTHLGTVIGTEEIFMNETVYVFKRIPYAEPPIGELRFQKPKPVNRWNKTLDGTRYGPSCWQLMRKENMFVLPNQNMSEDCLHLNVFIPKEISTSRPKAVMIWIHGGSFTIGQGMLYDGKTLALHGDVIVVTINYRLNVFGFFSLADDVARGNFGILDQREAIIWVKNNIVDYGGDPNRITLFGNSAGGVSVSLHAVIPKNQGLFQRAIQQSGTFLGPKDFKVESVSSSMIISRLLSCPTGVKSALIKCVRNARAEDLFKAYLAFSKMVKPFAMRIPLGPIPDGDLIPYDIRNLVTDPRSPSVKMFKSLDYMAGNTDGEAGLFLFGLFNFQKTFKFNVFKGIPTRVLCGDIVPAIAKELYQNCTNVLNSICLKYSPADDRNVSLQTQTDFSANFYGDFIKVSPTVRMLNHHSKYSNKATYQYMFTYKPNKGAMTPRPTWLKGANHVDEVPFIFGIKPWYGSNITVADEEVDLSSRIMTYWSNFAKYGNPNGNGMDIWKPYYMENMKYINFSAIDVVQDHLWKDRMDFWTTRVPNIYRDCLSMRVSAGVKHQYSLYLFILSIFTTRSILYDLSEIFEI